MDVFGVVASDNSLASVFTATVECLDYVHLGVSPARDFEPSFLNLTCTQVRLGRWGQALDIHSSPRFTNRDAEDEEVRLGKKILEQILILLRDAREVSQPYTSGEGFIGGSNDSPLAALNNNLRNVARNRRRGSTVLRATRWVMYDRTRLDHLVADTTRLVDSLERLFPAPGSSLDYLAGREVAVTTNREQLSYLSSAANHVGDKYLQAAISKSTIGHYYSDMRIQGKALTGDFFAMGWTAGAVGLPHSYNNIVIEKGAVAHHGNQYGGSKGIFDN